MSIFKRENPDIKNFKIDSHAHIMPPYRISALARWMKKAFPDHPVSENATPADVVDDLRQGGITHFFNLVYPLVVNEADGLNSFNVKFCKDIPGAIPFASIHQDTPDKIRFTEDTLKNHDVAGFKLHPFVQKFDPWDSKMEGFYACLQEAGKPVLFHTGFEDFYGKKMPLTELRKLLKRFPRLPVVFVHMAFPEIEGVFEMMDEFPELYLDGTGVFAFLRSDFQPFLPPELAGGKLAGILEKNLERYRERVFYGSDHPVGWGDIKTIFNDLGTLSVSEETRAFIRAGSAVAFVSKFLPGFDWSKNLQEEI